MANDFSNILHLLQQIDQKLTVLCKKSGLDISNLQKNRLNAVKQKQLTRYQNFANDMAYKGWKRACKKYAHLIKEIQENEPDWLPTLTKPY